MKARDNALRLGGALGLGAGFMYALDPVRGRRRRALMRDKITHLVSIADDALGATARDMANRARGIVAETRSRLFPDVDVPDDLVERRVRSRLGQYVSHPSAIGVVVSEGRVFLSGPILAHEVAPLISRILSIPGARSVVKRLDVHERPGDISALQGGTARNGGRFELLQSNWSPTARVLAAVAGGAIFLRGAGRRGPLGLLTSLLGGALFARGATNLELRRLVGIGAGRRAVDIQKTITVDLPLEAVWVYWRDYRYFPTFMSHVREVRDLGYGRSHWVVDGPGGTTVEWDAMLTAEEPNALIAWKTCAGSTVDHAGIVRFEPVGRSTRVHLRMSYNPPAGAIGHGIAALLGADAKRLMDEDLVRMKTFLETGKLPQDAAVPPSPSAAE